ALAEQLLEPPIDLTARPVATGAARLRLVNAIAELREVSRRDTGPETSHLDGELLRPLGRRRLERERPEPLLHLSLEIAGSFDLDLDTRELQLRTVTAPLEPSKPCSLLDKGTAL